MDTTDRSAADRGADPTPRLDDAPAVPAPRPDTSHQHLGHGRGHGLLMLVCCVPMVLVVGALVLSGAVGSGAIVYALLCVGMMAAMMALMPGHRR